MAKRSVNGKDILLFIDPDGGTAYKTIVCLTSNGLNRSTAVNGTTTKCGSDSAPGEKTTTIPFAGNIAYQAESNELSSVDMDSLWENSTTIGWKIGPATPVEGDVTRTGTGWISELNEEAPADGKATFTGTISVTGAIVKTVEPASQG